MAKQASFDAIQERLSESQPHAPTLLVLGREACTEIWVRAKMGWQSATRHRDDRIWALIAALDLPKDFVTAKRVRMATVVEFE